MPQAGLTTDSPILVLPYSLWSKFMRKREWFRRVADFIYRWRRISSSPTTIGERPRRSWRPFALLMPQPYMRRG